MPEFYVVLIATKYTGNLGAVARVMKNFGISKLRLVDPPEIDDDAISRSMHAIDVLENAETYYSITDAFKGMDMIVGTSGINTLKEKHFLRHSETPAQFTEDIRDYEGQVALVFGREDIGLTNEELMRCDRLITIPTSSVYPIMNLSHAVGVILYELYKIMGEEITENDFSDIVDSDKERLLELFANILCEVEYPPHKRNITETMFRKILGRANITSTEYHRLMGVFNYIESKLK